MNEITYNQEEVQELFDVVFKLSAKDINDKLIKVRNRPDIAKRRWFWELVQNAKDTVDPDEKVDILLIIEKNNEQNPLMTFSHNGKPFRYQDAKNLIFPYSDKEEEVNSDKTGRFGTGFLATHILSTKIIVKGIYVKNKEAYDFHFTLDRSGANKNELAELISKTWHSFRTNRVKKINYEYPQKKFDTQFSYPLTNEKLELVNESIQDLQLSLPFTLAFIPKINTVTIINEITGLEITYKVNNTINLDPQIKEYTITKIINQNGIKKEFNINIVLCSDGETEIGIEIENNKENIYIKQIPIELPKIFCSFPLIGADDFPFPVIINSGHFIPKEERNGIWLSNTIEGIENQKLLEKVVPLFKLLVDYISKNSWIKTYELFKTLKNKPNTIDLDINWYISTIQNPVKQYTVNVPLVDTELGDRLKCNDITFPFHEKIKVREKIWELLSNKKTPKKCEIHKWYEVIWDDLKRINIKSIAEYVDSQKNIDTLCKIFNNDKSCYNWLNKLVILVLEENEIILNNTQVLPNQFGVFKRKDELYLDDNSIDEELKDILADISKFRNGVSDWRNELLDKNIFLELPQNKTRNIADIARIIVENVKILLKEDNPTKEYQDLFSKLLNWLNDNPILYKKFFKELKIDTLLYKTTNESKLRHFTELLKKDRDGEVSVESLVTLDSKKIALLNDPDLEIKLKLGEEILNNIRKEKQEFEFKKKTGDIFEELFQELINEDDRFNIQKVEGEEDFIITNKLNQKKYYIELKSIRPDEQKIQMTHKQAKKAHRYPSNYILCIIKNNGINIINKEYLIKNSIFDNSVGIKLSKKVDEALIFEADEDGISIEFEDNLLSMYKKYRYKFIINELIWGKDDFYSFKNKLLQ